MGYRAPEVVSAVLRGKSLLLRQGGAETNSGPWRETDHKRPGMVRSGVGHVRQATGDGYYKNQILELIVRLFLDPGNECPCHMMSILVYMQI